MKNFFLVVFLVAVYCLPTMSQSAGFSPSISVIGEAEMSVSPDTAIFTLEVISLDKNLTFAKRTNDDAVAKALAVAKGQKVDDIETEQMTISPKYRGLKTGPAQEFIGYEVTKRLRVTTSDLKSLDSFLSNVIAAGVNRVVSVTFVDSQERQHQEQVRALAVKNARDKATAYAQQLGQRIGKAYSIREEGADSPTSSTFSNEGASGYGSGDGIDDSNGRDAFQKPGPLKEKVTFSIGQVTIEERIYIIFRLE